MAELSTVADWALRTLTGMPGTSPIVHIALFRAVIGEAREGHDVLAELLDAGRAARLDEHHYQLDVVMQPASDDLTGYGTVLMWHARDAARADRTIQPDSLRLGLIYEQANTPFSSPAAAVNWFRDNETRLLQMLNGAMQYGLYDVLCELAEPLWALARYIGHNNTAVMSQFAAIDALNHFDDGQRERRRATASARVAFSLSSMGLHEEAIANADSAVLRASALDDALVLSIAHSVRGRAHEFAGNLIAAIEEYEISLTLAEKVEDARSIALRHRRIASAKAKRGDTTTAVITHLRTAEKLMIEIGDRHGHARVLTYLGQALLDAGQPAEALAAITPAFEALHAAANALHLAEAAAIAAVAAENIDPALARGHYVLAIGSFDAHGMSEQAADAQRQYEEFNTRSTR